MRIPGFFRLFFALALLTTSSTSTKYAHATATYDVTDSADVQYTRASTNPRAPTATVTVDGAVEYQAIEGGGLVESAGGDPYPIPLSDVAAQMYALGFRDFSIRKSQYLETNNDDGDPFHYNWDSGPNSFNQQFAAGDADLQIAKAYQDAGLDISLEAPWTPQWMMTQNGSRWEFDSTIPGVYDEVAEYWAAYLLYASNNHGLDFTRFSPTCEPEVNTSTIWEPAEIRDAIKAVGARLTSESLAARITTPHAALISNSRNYLQTIMADAGASAYLDAVAHHAYDHNLNDPTQMRNFANDALIQASGLPIWMSEWVLQGTTGYPKRSEAYVETLSYALEWAKFVHYCYVDGQCSLITPSPGVCLEYAKDEGMFGPGLGAGGLRMKKFGHSLVQYHRFIEPGSRRIDTSVSGVSDLFVTAARHQTSGTLAIVMLNKSTSSVNVTVSMNNLSSPGSVRAVRTSATEDSAELGRVPVSGDSFTVDLPGESVTTYVGSTIADSTSPSVPTGVGAEALSDTLVRVTWNASTDNVAVAEYNIFRGGEYIGVTAGNSYVDNGLSRQVNYTYTVSAFDPAGNESAQSPLANVTTLADTTSPAVPENVAATPRPNGVTVTWDPSTDSVQDHDLSGFRVSRASSLGGPYTLLADLGDPAATGYVDISATNGQTYYYVVTSYDDEDPANESATSNEASATPYYRLAGGLSGDYYDSAYVNQGGGVAGWDWFDTLNTSRVDATVDFDWEHDTPPAGQYIKGLYGSTYHWCLFGVRWQGEVLADYSETYTFETANLDGARLWVDENLIVDDWGGWFTHNNTDTVSLTAGWHTIRLDYYRYHPEVGEDGIIRLYYSSPSVPKQIIPSDHLATVSADAPHLVLRGTSADQAIYLGWTVTGTLPVTSTWQIDHRSQTGTAHIPITGIISPTRAYSLTNLTNYVWYTVTLSAMLDSTAWLSDTVRVKPTDIFVYLPLVLRGQ